MCDARPKGEQVHSKFKPKNSISTSRPLELLHMGVCEVILIQSLRRSKYIPVIVADYSLFTWVSFLKEKEEAFKEFSKI